MNDINVVDVNSLFLHWEEIRMVNEKLKKPKLSFEPGLIVSKKLR